MTQTTPTIPAIIDQHAENTAFNWLLRDKAVFDPHYDLFDLSHLDDRVEANIDGLRIAGDEGWDICREAMELTEAVGEVFAAGVLAFESKDPDHMDTMLAAVENKADLQRALISALGWIDFGQIDEPANRLMGADLPFLRFIGLSTLAIHRRDPGYALARLIKDLYPTIRARALKAVGELGRVDLLPQILDHLTDSDHKCRFYAAWSATLLGSPQGVAALKRIAESDSPYAEPACTLVVRKLPPREASGWLESLRRIPEKVRLAITGFGALGDPVFIPLLMGQMQVPELARPAGEAFSMITGVDLAYEDLEGEWPEGFEAGPTEDPEDEDVSMDPDEDLPWPDVELIQPWWDQNKSNFKNGARYLLGKSIGPETLQDSLKNGFQRQRIAAAIELATGNPGSVLFECRAPGIRQEKLLGIR